MSQLIACTSEGVYPLTRGRQYELLAHNTEKEQVRVCADHGRRRWFPAYCFDLSGGHAPVLASWYFGEAVVDALNGLDETYNWVGVVLTFDDGTERWCQMTTPDYLKGLLERSVVDPMCYGKYLIVVRDLAVATVEQVLRSMNGQGDLIEFSKLIEDDEDSGEEPE